jgi:Mrp family chromosome partitioning ATPase
VVVDVLGGAGPRTALLLAADACAWEQAAMEAVAAAGPSVVLLKRCLDLPDLLASASTGTAQVAVVAEGLLGLDADSVGRLARHGVRVVAVTDRGSTSRRSADEEVAERSRLLRLGVARVVDATAVAGLAAVVREAAEIEPEHGAIPERLGGGSTTGAAEVEVPHEPPERDGRLVAVWGATGAPGRSTVAISVAAEAAAGGLHVTLVDADPYGGAVAQHLGVLEEVSGLLAATRLANTGQLDRQRLAMLARQVSPRLRLVTGLPRPDRWPEVRTQAFARLLTAARELDELVVVDTGFGLPTVQADPFGSAPARDDTTLTAVQEADEILMVAAADPVGLTRLARAMRDLGEVRDEGPVRVVVNRMRPGLGWSETEVADLVGRVSPDASVSFLPDDRASADRALVSGRTLRECGDSALRRAVAALTDELTDDLGLLPRRTRSRRRLLRR